MESLSFGLAVSVAGDFRSFPDRQRDGFQGPFDFDSAVSDMLYGSVTLVFSVGHVVHWSRPPASGEGS